MFKERKNNSKSDAEIKRLNEENVRLRRAVDELAILNNLALSIGGSLDSEKIMKSIIGKSIRSIEAEQGDITLVATDEFNPSHTLVRSMISSNNNEPLHLNQNLIGWMQINKKPLLMNDPKNDQRFRNVKWDSTIRSVLSAPLMAKSRLIGILTVYNKLNENNSGFTESDQRLLSIIAAQSAQVVENARLYEEEKTLQFVRRELELASDIQKKMLPSAAPLLEGYKLSGKNLTAQTVGGDYYDFIRIDDHRWAFCLGDISGKGLPASLLMSNLQAILRGQALHLSEPSAILKCANHQLYQSTSPEKFATLFLGILDTSSGTLTYSCAGHEYPFLIKPDGSHIRLTSGGVPLAVLDEQEFMQDTIQLEKGDCIFVYSDGITDNMDENDDQYGEERLQELLVNSGSELSSPENLIEIIFKSSIDFSKNTNRFDDMTAVVLTRNL